MRIDEMHYTFNLELDRIASFDKRDFEVWEIDNYLNRAIIYISKERYGISKPYRGFETDQSRISQLSYLHIKSPELQPAIVPTDLGNGRYEVKLSALGNNINSQNFRYLFLTDGFIEATKDGCTKLFGLNQWRIDTKKTNYNDASWTWRRVLANFGKSTTVFPSSSDLTIDLTDSQNTFLNYQLGSLYFDTNDKYESPQFTITRVFLSYIKYPNRVFFGGYDHIDGLSSVTDEPVHCDIDEAFHDEIVAYAVKLARQDILDPQAIQVSEMQTTPMSEY